LNAVGWYPVYDARVEFDKVKVNLSAFAVVRQTTGEDWQDVQLTLSTSMPSVGGRMPELNQWYLRPRQVQSIMRADGGRRSKSANLEVVSDALMDSDKSASMMAAAPQAAETAYAKADASGVSLTYKAARPVTVKSDGSEVRVPLNVQTLDASLQYAATPKLSTYAYLRSLVTNSPEEQLMAGRVNVFLDGTYVGNSDIIKTIPPGAPFDLYLGVDEGVGVKRELIEQKSDDTLIGNIPSPTKKITYTYKITVESFKSKAVTVKVFDQIPVAQDDKIRVVKVMPSLKPDTEMYQDREGVYLWTLQVQPKEKKELTLSYVVEYPREMNIEGL
jgi:uncharacterized protein (TIGR02231 family)